MKLNILYLIPSLSNSGGMERVLTEKVNYLVKTGKYEVFIVTTEMEDNELPFFSIDPCVKVINLKIRFNKNFNSNIFSKIAITKRLLALYEMQLEKIILENKIDICISMGGKELEFLGGAYLPCKKVYECHFEKKFKSKFLSFQGKSGFIWKLYGKLRDWQHFKFASKFDAFIVLSNGAFNDWIQLSPLPIIIANPSPIHVDTNAVLDLSSKRVITIGNLISVKGYDLLINAWALIAPRYPEWSLDIFGQGELQNELQNQINSLMLTGSIKLVGTTKNVKSELLKSAFYVMSSRSEGLPMVLIESISCGIPIVAFDCETGPREIIKNNDCGILVENGNIQKLALTIEKMILNPMLRKKMSINAIEKSKEYELQYIMNKWENLFHSLIK